MKIHIFSLWTRNNDGAAAIEFAIVAMPFFLICVAIIELAMMFTANSLMMGATQDAVRAIRTGQVQVISDPDEAENFFRQQLCDHISVALVNCNDVQFSVSVLDSFSGANTTTQVDEEGNIDEPEFDAGGSGDIVLVNVLYYHPLLTPLIGRFFSDSPNNTKLLTSTVVFQTEPYTNEDDVI